MSNLRYVLCTNAPAMARAIQRIRSASGETIGMFAAGITVIVDVAVLFPRFGSGFAAEALTVAVFTSGPGVAGRRLSVTVAVAPLASVGNVHVSVVLIVHKPPGVAATKVVFGGMTSVTVTAVAGF